MQTIEDLVNACACSASGILTLKRGEAAFSLSVHGANLISYIPTQEVGEVIWTGGYEPASGRDCWGGIPLVWPWFMMGCGHPPQSPFHGPARYATWEILDLNQNEATTELRLGLPGPLQDAAGVPIPLEIELRVQLAESLHLEMVTRNPTNRPHILEHCFHAYFRVGDVTRAHVHGLAGTEAQDNRRPGSPRERPSGPVTLDGPAARIYRPFPECVTIVDPALRRRITLRSLEAAQLVLWNAGPLRKENGKPTGEAAWRTQLALEPLCGMEEAITLQPGEEARLTLEIRATLLA